MPIDKLYPFALNRPDGYQIFFVENQGVYAWAIRGDDAMRDDPPVYVTEDESEWHLESHTLTDFLISMAYWQDGLGLPYSGIGCWWVTPAEVKLIRSRFKPACQPFLYAWQAEFYANHDDESLVIMSPPGDEPQTFYAALSQEHLETMQALLDSIGEPI